MRNSAQIESMHDLRGFLWQCYWAVGNRAELLRRTLRSPSLVGRLPDA